MRTPESLTGRTGLARPLFVLLSLAVPLLALGNALLVLLLPWMADAQYALPGFPSDPLGLDGRDRAGLAQVGIRSIWPFGDGLAELERASLPDGSAAFTSREVRHMEDVRDLVRVVLVLWLVAGMYAGGILFAARRRGQGPRASVALGKGALLTVGMMAAIFLASLVAFEPFFDGFHALFFEADTWKFKDHYTLRRLYPDAFWLNATVVMCVLILAQAVIVGLRTGVIRRPFRDARPWPRRR